MKYIIEVDGEISTRYKYNLWSTIEHEDGSLSKDRRIIAADDLKEFLELLPVTL